MMRKFAVALIATTMLVAPALAADAVKSTPAAPVAAASTAAPTVTPARKDVSKAVTKTDKHLKTVKVAHRHAHHTTFAKNGKHPSHVKTAKVTKPVNAVTAAPAASTPTPVASTASQPAVKTIKAGTDLNKVKAVHHHTVRHLTTAKNGKHSVHVKTAKVSKPVKHPNVGKGQVAHVAKSNKVTAN
jgi:hypothetical protein